MSADKILDEHEQKLIDQAKAFIVTLGYTPRQATIKQEQLIYVVTVTTLCSLTIKVGLPPGGGSPYIIT